MIINKKKYALTTSRILLGAILIVYAYAKFSGNQFVKINLDQNVNTVEPVLLVFYFFGYSQPYALFCGLAELAIGLLTAIPKTTRLGMLLYFPFTLNIAVINWCFGFPLETKILISSLVVLSLVVIIADRKAYLGLLSLG